MANHALQFINGKFAVVVATVLLFASIAYGGYQIFQTPEPKPLGNIELNSQNSQISLNDVTQYHLFGSVLDVNNDANNEPYDRPSAGVENVEIVVTGILASNVERLSKATLLIDGGAEKTYNVGDKLTKSDAVVLARIETGYVTVNNHGIDQEYTLVRPPLTNHAVVKERDLGLLPKSSPPAQNYSNSEQTTINHNDDYSIDDYELDQEMIDAQLDALNAKSRGLEEVDNQEAATSIDILDNIEDFEIIETIIDE